MTDLNTLLAKAREESAANWRKVSRSGSESFIRDAATRSIQQSYGYARRQAKLELSAPPELPIREGGSERDRARMEELRASVLAGRKKTQDMIRENHRLGLIKLFTMGEGGTTQATAEAIVDLLIKEANG